MMSARSRFNLTLLRNLKDSAPPHEKAAADYLISRRAFLTLSGASATIAAIPSYLSGDGFSIAQRGQAIYVLTDQQVRWTIDAARFGGGASVRLKRERNRVEISLVDAVFPGTDFPADFWAVLSKSPRVWVVRIAMKCGLNFEADLVSWLCGRSSGSGTLDTTVFTPLQGVTINQSSRVLASFSPSWNLAMRGVGEVILDRLPHGLRFTEWNISLDANEQLAGGEPADRTLLHFPRPQDDWHVPLARQAAEGWSLQHDSGVFDNLYVEGLCRNNRRVQTALLCGRERTPSTLYLHPGGDLLSDSAEPFRIKLERPRLAFGLENAKAHSALIADVSTEPVWAHAPEMSVLLASSREHPHFELLESEQGADVTTQPTVTPQVICADIPCGSDANIKVMFNGKHPLHFNWATGIQWPERILGGLHLTPWESHLAFDLTCDHEIRLLRPRDQFQLTFRFENMRVCTGFGSKIHKRKHIPPPPSPGATPPAPPADKQVHCEPIPGRVPRITVIFPPQHLAERAFFESLKNPPTVLPLGTVELHDGINSASLDPDVGNTKSEDRSLPVESRLAGNSQLVFELPPEIRSIPFDFKGLLNWQKWKPIITATAKIDAPSSKSPPLLKNADPTDPDTDAYATAIEMPYRVFLSPTDRGGWAHAVDAVDYGTSYAELWHTRLGVLSKGSIDEHDAANRIGRAIWSPDFSGAPLPEHDNIFPFRTSMDRRDRAEVVHLTSNYSLQDPKDSPFFQASPLQFERLMLTPMGGYLRSLGAWNPPRLKSNPSSANDFLTVEQWRHDAVLLRDQFVRVVYKGYLLPFAHRASLVKITERVFRPVTLSANGTTVYAAFLHQYMYLTLQHPRRDYPLLGQSYSGRGFAFTRVDVLTASTPPIDEPNDQTLFWPMVGGVAFPLQFKFWDQDGNTSVTSANVLFVGAGVAQVKNAAQNAIGIYHAGVPGVSDSLVSKFNGQQIAFGPSTKPGDTRYNVKSITWDSDFSTANTDTLYRNDLPCFAPEVGSADISSSTINRISGKNPTDTSSLTTVSFYPNYLQSGFDPKANRGEVMLQVEANPLSLQFGGANGNVDKSGGLVSPDSLVVGFSRSAGPVGGRSADVAAPGKSTITTTSSLDIHASGNFDPAAFFGGLASSKILGAVKLSDVIGAFAQGIGSDLNKIPKMLETALGAVDQTAFDAEAIVINQVFEPIQKLVESVHVLVGPMAKPASEVRSAWTAVNAAHASTSAANSTDKVLAEAAEARVHAELIGNLLKYGTALQKLLEDPLAIAEQAALDALSAIIGPDLQSLQQALGDAFNALVDSLIKDAESKLNDVLGLLNDLATDAAKSLRDPLQDIDKLNATVQNVKNVLLSDVVPDLVTCIEAKPIAEDLITRVKALTTTQNASPQLKLLQVLAGLGPVVQDILQLEEKFGLVGLVTAQKNSADAAAKAAFDAANKLQTTIIGELHKIVNVVVQNETAVSNALDEISNACLILAALPGFVDSAATLQNLRQLQRSIDKLKTATKNLDPIINTADEQQKKLAWRCSVLQRQLVRQTLEAALALRHIADAAKASADTRTQQASQALIAACRAVTDLLNIAPQLKNKRAACLTAILDDAALTNPKFGTSGVLGVAVMQFDRLDVQLNTLETQITGTAADLTTQLSLSLQYINIWLQYQGPIAAIYGWDLYEDAYVGLRAVSQLSNYSQWAADRAKELRSSCLQVKTQAVNIRNAINNVSPQDVAIASAKELEAVADTMSRGFGFFGNPEPAVGIALERAAQGLTAAGQFLAKLKQEVTDLQNDVKLIEQIVAQLPDLLRRIPEAISIELTLDWHPNIRSFEPVFRLEDGADLVVKASTVISLAQASSPHYNISATLQNFSINLIGEPSFIIVSIKSLQFTSVNGSKPDCKLEISNVTFGSAMAFVRELAALLNPGQGPFLEFAGGMVNAGYRFQVPSMIVGGFNLMQLSLEVSIGLPFNGDPVRCYFGISRADNPFLLSIGIYGGSGYLLMRLGLDGVQRLEGSLAFGVVAIVKIGPLTGYGEVVAGIHFAIGSGSSEVCGFVQAHGHCDIFGIVSLDVNVHVDMCYQDGSVRGQAQFTVDIEMLFFSVSYTFTASYAFAGSPTNRASLERPGDIQLAALEIPPLPFGGVDAPASLPAGILADLSPGAVIDNNRIDPKAWRAYFNSFDTFPDEVHS
jgi:hypothetical protein